MITPTTTSEHLLFTTVRIETLTSTGAHGTGTGFHYTVKMDDGGMVPLLVTNKHVVKDAVEGTLRLHEIEHAGEDVRLSGGSATITIPRFEEQWIQHPSDDIDLCAMPMAMVYEAFAGTGSSVFTRQFDQTYIWPDEKLEELRAVEDILMVGYPNGLWDSANNLPLVRQGITASHPGVDFNGRAEIVVDIACFPGSSGSPVLIFNEGLTHLRGGNVKMESRLILLGVLYAGPQWTVDGDIMIQTIPVVQSIPISRTNIMMHLGYIIKAREILVLADAVKRMAQQEEEPPIA